ncbi:MAG: hypothetical protein V1729_01450 [Candidatus Woesearchaeota archaeon]
MEIKKQLQKTGEFLDEIVDTSTELFKRRVESQGEAYRQAVEEGWFKYFLIGAGAVGAAIVTKGLIQENETATAFGAGILVMDALYSSIIYIPRLYRKRNEK